MGSKSPGRDTKGLGKRERGSAAAYQEEESPESVQALKLKAVAGADLQIRREVEILSETATEQSRIIKEMRDLLLPAWGADDVAKSGDVHSHNNKGKLGQGNDLRQEAFMLAVEEARRRMVRRQACRGMLIEATHMVAEQEEQQD